MIRFAVTQFFPGCVPSDPDDAVLFDTVAEAREHMREVALEACGDDRHGGRQVLTVNDNLVQVAWGEKGQGWYVEVAECDQPDDAQPDGSGETGAPGETDPDDPDDPDDDWDHQTGYSPRFIVTHSDASIEWTAGDFD